MRINIWIVPHREQSVLRFLKTNRLMLRRKIIIFYYMNHAEHTNTLFGQYKGFSGTLTTYTVTIKLYRFN